MPLEKKSINKMATVQNLTDWANRSIGHHMDTEKLNELLASADWESRLKEICNWASVEVVYQ